MKLKHSQPSLASSDYQALKEAFESKYLAKGPKTKAFEEALKEKYHRSHAIFVSSGMAALHLSLHALNIGSKDSVALPSYVCTALLNAIHLCQAKPVLVDTPHHDFLINPSPPSKNVQAIIYPQMFGAQTTIKPSNNTPIIEDCAMSLGPQALQQGTLSITSFYATKMITTGQGGAILTDNDGLAESIRDLISYDNREDYKLRFNYAPTDIAASLGLAQLSKLDLLLEKRKDITQTYDELIKQHTPELLARPEGLAVHYPYLFRYWIKTPHQKALTQHLESHDIEAKSPVYKPLHRYLGHPDSDYPHTSLAQDTFVSLPFYSDLETKDIKRVVETLKSFNPSLKL